MRSHAKLLVGGVLALLPIDATAESSGNELLDNCRQEATVVEQAWCLGFLNGVGVFLLRPADGDVRSVQYVASVCVPSSVTLVQMKDIVVQYLQSHPERRHFGNAFLVHEALVAAFPCE